jgi:uroporphyrinogen-III synthase
VKYSHVFITRPQPESEELSALLTPLGLQCVIQPAFTYAPLAAKALQKELFAELDQAGSEALLIFTSPRAVTHGLSQLPDGLLFQARVTAIGPATAKALEAAGIRVDVRPRKGYTSEALLETLDDDSFLQPSVRARALIIAAPGGRRKLFEGLKSRGWKPDMVMVYESAPAKLDKHGLKSLQGATGLLCVWTSANAMKALSQRLPPAAWFRLCQGEWLVISERLRRLARAYGPARIHLSQGPGNTDLLSAIRGLV